MAQGTFAYCRHSAYSYVRIVWHRA